MSAAAQAGRVRAFTQRRRSISDIFHGAVVAPPPKFAPPAVSSPIIDPEGTVR